MSRSKTPAGAFAGHLKPALRWLGERLADAVAFVIVRVFDLLACLFAAEVALGRRVAGSDADLEHLRSQRRSGFHKSLPTSASPVNPLSTAVGRGVTIPGLNPGHCHVSGMQTPRRLDASRTLGFSRCVHFPPCRQLPATSRFSLMHGTALPRFNSASRFPSPPRRPRQS